MEESINKIKAIRFAMECYMIVGGKPKELLEESVEWLHNCYKFTEDTMYLKAEKHVIQALCLDGSVKCKVTKIREVLGYWPCTSKENYNAEVVARDILHKVCNREYGCFFYEKKDSVPSFELLIMEEDAYLLDLERGRIYIFEKECKGE